MNSTNFPSNGTTSDVGGIISANKRKNTVKDSKMDMLNDTWKYKEIHIVSYRDYYRFRLWRLRQFHFEHIKSIFMSGVWGTESEWDQSSLNFRTYLSNGFFAHSNDMARLSEYKKYFSPKIFHIHINTWVHSREYFFPFWLNYFYMYMHIAYEKLIFWVMNFCSEMYVKAFECWPFLGWFE